MTSGGPAVQPIVARRHVSLQLILCLAGTFALQNLLNSGEPHIELIQRFSTNQVTIHFGTEANRAYELQCLVKWTTNNVSGQSNSMPIGVWSNLFVIPAIPFPNHYVIADTITNEQRLYRLRVTP
jgi:hypothetical protein